MNANINIKYYYKKNNKKLYLIMFLLFNHANKKY